MLQLNLFGHDAAINTAPQIQPTCTTITAPKIVAIESPVTAASIYTAAKVAFTIEPNPSNQKGFRVVMAPGLTSKTPPNPCLSCDSVSLDMDNCSEFCKHESVRSAYLNKIGLPLISSANGDGQYGVNS